MSPIIPVVSLDPASNAYPNGYHLGNSGGLSAVDVDLVAAKIKLGMTIFGVTGTMVAWMYDLLAEMGLPPTLHVPVPTIALATAEDHSGGGQTDAHTLTVPAPTLAQTSVQATIAAFDGGVSHKQAGPIDADETAATNNATANDMNLLPAAGNSTGDGFYFGMNGLWDGLTLNVGTAGVGTYTIAWKYWNGAWVALTLTSVNSINHFKTAGLVNLTFVRPGDWAVTNIAGLGDKYYIKAECTFTSLVTQPKGTQAWALAY
jgi:hypothetical protein